jgi:hypothetical protein
MFTALAMDENNRMILTFMMVVMMVSTVSGLLGAKLCANNAERNMVRLEKDKDELMRVKDQLLHAKIKSEASKEFAIAMLKRQEAQLVEELSTVCAVLDLRCTFEEAMRSVDPGLGSAEAYIAHVKHHLILPDNPVKLTQWAKGKLIKLEGAEVANFQEKNIAVHLADIHHLLCSQTHFFSPSATVGLRCTGDLALRAAAGIVFLWTQKEGALAKEILYGEKFHAPNIRLSGGRVMMMETHGVPAQ